MPKRKRGGDLASAAAKRRKQKEYRRYETEEEHGARLQKQRTRMSTLRSRKNEERKEDENVEVKPEPMDDEDTGMLDIKIEIEEHPVTPHHGKCYGKKSNLNNASTREARRKRIKRVQQLPEQIESRNAAQRIGTAEGHAEKYQEQYVEVKPEPMDDEGTGMLDIKIEVEEHPVAPHHESIPTLEPCTRQMLPRINMFSIIEYFVHNRTYAALDYYKLKTEIDINAEETIGFLEIHSTDDNTTIQGQVAFNRHTSHTCVIKYNSKASTIEYTNCVCSKIGCEHVIALLMWLHRRSEEQLDNDMSFYIEPIVQQTVCIKAKDMFENSDTDSPSEELDPPESVAAMQHDFVHSFLKTCKEMNQYNSPLYRYLSGDSLVELSMPRLFVKWRESAASLASPDLFLEYCTENMDADIKELSNCRADTARRELQRGRLSASHVAALADCTGDTEALLHTVLHPEPRTDDPAIENIKKTLEAKLNIVIEKCSILINRDYPIFCTTPYGFTDTHIIDLVLIEPHDINNYMIGNALTQEIKYKLLLHMLLASKNKAYFFICFKGDQPNKKILIHEYNFNRKVCDEFLSASLEFWKAHVFDKLDTYDVRNETLIL